MSEQKKWTPPKNYRKALTEDEKEMFAYELALGYYTPDELRHIFKIINENFNNYMASEDMRFRVLRKKREIDESPDALRIHARRAARVAIEELGKLVQDEEAPAKTRMEAGKQLREYAMIADKEALTDPDGGGAVIIKTNLDLQTANGVYAISAQEVDEQEAEEFDDLLGVPT